MRLTETLTAEIEVPVDPWEEERERRLEQEAEAREAEEEDADEPERPVMVPLMTPLLPGPLRREYLVVQVSEEGDESEGGERIAVPLGVRPPEPPPRRRWSTGRPPSTSPGNCLRGFGKRFRGR